MEWDALNIQMKINRYVIESQESCEKNERKALYLFKTSTIAYRIIIYKNYQFAQAESLFL